MSRPAIIFLTLFSALLLSGMQSTPSGSSQASSSQADMANRAEGAQLKRFSAADEARALQGDIKRMRGLVQQMQQNLAFVDATQSPLKHQFQLEIDAWNTIIDQMERRAQASGK
ncbi:MAG TPA: hypothetical protein VFR84_12300 [Candidatus Angelobacter sp.]|nr:hypothetical protein [Candidatus Angelobacter sp.]